MRWANAATRGRPCPLHRGQRTSRSATRIEASGSRGFTRKSKSVKPPQLSQRIKSHGCRALIAVAIVGQKPAEPLFDSRALKSRTIASASCSISRPRFSRSMLSRISMSRGRRWFSGMVRSKIKLQATQRVSGSRSKPCETNHSVSGRNITRNLKRYCGQKSGQKSKVALARMLAMPLI